MNASLIPTSAKMADASTLKEVSHAPVLRASLWMLLAGFVWICGRSHAIWTIGWAFVPGT
jgi:hypothetical protein